MFSFWCVCVCVFTVENVCKAVQGVNWASLGRILLIAADKYSEIEQLQSISNEKRLQAVVECWLGEGEAARQKPSWRSLIIALDNANETRVADNMRNFAEPVPGKSCFHPT